MRGIDKLIGVIFFLLIFLTSGFAAEICSPGLIRALKEEGLKDKQISIVCEKAKLYDGEEKDISGAYIKDGRKLYIKKDGKFMHPEGGGEYMVSGNKIVVSNPMVGTAEGEIQGNKLIFPLSKHFFGQSFQGTWVKQ